MTPQEKRKRTIIQRYGSYKNMLKKRDVGDLSLGGYNGGIKRHEKKGFGSWDKEKITKFTKSRKRDSRGRFVQSEDGQQHKGSL